MSFDFATLTEGVISHADAVRQICARVLEGKTSYADVVRQVQPADLRMKTEQFFDVVQSIVAEATDAAVVFVPDDPMFQKNQRPRWRFSPRRQGNGIQKPRLKRESWDGRSPGSLHMSRPF